jgi:protein-S-isoprenylcysteine O-methyltransferase Ste14
MKDDVAGVITKPPFIYAGALLVGFALHFALPVRFLPDGSRPLGWTMMTLAVFLVMWAFRTMRRAGTNVDVHKPTTALVMEGPYRFTRNPMYVSLTLFYSGIGVAANALWVLALLPVVLLIMRNGVILREERYLERKFGETYLQYKANVRRWI